MAEDNPRDSGRDVGMVHKPMAVWMLKLCETGATGPKVSYGCVELWYER